MSLSEDYPPPIVQVSSTKPVPPAEAAPTIVRIPTTRGIPKYQPHVIRATLPPAPTEPPHVVRPGTPSHAQEERQWIRVTSAPRQVVDHIPQLVHLTSALKAEISPQITRVATAIPQTDPTPAQVFHVGTPGYPQVPQTVHVGAAKPSVEDQLAQIIRVGTPSYPEPSQTPQATHVGVQPTKEVADPEIVHIRSL